MRCGVPPAIWRAGASRSVSVVGMKGPIARRSAYQRGRHVDNRNERRQGGSMSSAGGSQAGKPASSGSARPDGGVRTDSAARQERDQSPSQPQTATATAVVSSAAPSTDQVAQRPRGQLPDKPAGPV